MPHDLIIRNARIVTPDAIVRGDIAVAEGRIAAVGQADGGAAQTLDAGGMTVTPGGVDPHAHIEQMSGMGLMNADTFETATRSALFGGTTSVISFAAQQKGERLRDTITNYAARADRGAMIDHAFHLIISDASVPDFHADLAALMRSGHRSVKVFTTYNIQLDDAAILSVMSAVADAGGVVCVHAENDAIVAREREALLAAGRTEPYAHALSRPRMAEIEAVSRMCHFAEHTGAAVMLFHISTAEAVDVIRDARARDVSVRAETCPHYLLMTEDVLHRDEAAKWMCSPPQRLAADQAALWAGLRDGTLDLISSDHAPYRMDATGKLSAGPDAPFHQIANGLPGLEPRLPLMATAIGLADDEAVMDLVRWTATHAAALYGLDRKGAIEPGRDADLVIWDDGASLTYGEDDLHDNVGYNPWSGHTLHGLPQTVLLRGKVVLEKGRLTATPGQGKWIDRGPTDWAARGIG